MALRDPRKRQGVASNYAQILNSIALIKNIDDFEPLKKIISTLKTLTSQYLEFLNPRDMAEITAALCILSKIVPKEAIQSSSTPKTNPLSSEPPK
jgi:hypothetical protein